MDFFGFNLPALIVAMGYVGLFSIIFAESGLFFGFFLPGDSLLFTAGFLASQDLLNIYWLLTLLTIGAIAGDTVGYAFGYRVGIKLFARPDSRFFKQSYLKQAQDFYRQYGKKALVFARFLPIVRTFVPIVAGVAQMDYKDFWRFNAIGGVLWVFSVTLLGYFLGATIPGVEEHLSLIIIAIIIVSLAPTIIEIIRQRASLD